MAATTVLWERMAVRTRATGVMATLESPATVARYSAFTLLAATMSTAAFAILFLVFGESTAALVTFALAAGFLATLVWMVAGRGVLNIQVWIRAIVVLSAVNHIAVHVSMGGYANSGFYVGWGVAVVLTESLWLPKREIVIASIFYVVFAVLAGFLESNLAATRPAPTETLSTVLFVWMLVGLFLMLLPVFVYFLDKLTAERQRSEELLLNVLPAQVAAELKLTGRTKARRFDQVSILFADTVGFTSLAAEMDPELVVSELNDVFSYFDSLAVKYGCEKIHTIGDAYMVASGLPHPQDDHALLLADMAIDMLAYRGEAPLQFRIGINSGPAVAGVIGTSKFQYDVWGDTVNTASRMESHGVPGRIQITESTRELIKDRYHCIPRGPVEVKGKGVLNTWFLEGRLAPEVPAPV